MKKWNMVIDIARCQDCNNCFLADKDEFVGNDWPPYSAAQPHQGHRWLNIERKERGQYPLIDVAYLPLLCQHCGNAPCIKNSPAGTIYRRDDGLVIIHPEKAKGHKEIVSTCPYGAIYWNEEANLPQKCTGCAHLMDEGWTQTRCSQVCPTEAITLVLAEDGEMARMVQSEELQEYRSSLATKPRVLFRNIHRWNKVFLAGNVVYKDTDEVAEGVRVTLASDGRAVGEAETNNYGDFKVDGLDPGEYVVTFKAKGYEDLCMPVEVGEKSTSLESVFLERD
ncbi:MAG: carboxypeptidase regulatory-like domain-containing protein [Actinobacteria bacterium]|nr:carboxypeptidase regulatory-like domain-containing protein [Actinomycetota bacterium]